MTYKKGFIYFWVALLILTILSISITPFFIYQSRYPNDKMDPILEGIDLVSSMLYPLISGAIIYSIIILDRYKNRKLSVGILKGIIFLTFALIVGGFIGQSHCWYFEDFLCDGGILFTFYPLFLIGPISILIARHRSKYIQ